MKFNPVTSESNPFRGYADERDVVGLRARIADLEERLESVERHVMQLLGYALEQAKGK